MQDFYATFQEKIIRTSHVFSFRFLPEKRVDFFPGQFVQVIFDEKDRSNKVFNKYLSFSSSSEKSFFEVTKKISQSEFSSCLMRLTPGDRLLFKGPMGSCLLDEQRPKLGFWIGGIGITPVIAMLEHAVVKGLSHDIVLLYSNWTEQDIAFRSELEMWTRKMKNIRITHVLMECPSGKPAYAQGMITQEIIETHMGDYRERLIYIVGPPAMVNAMKGIAQQLGIEKDKIKTENFVGY